MSSKNKDRYCEKQHRLTFFKVTHREAHCCSGSWACFPGSQHVFLTDLYQQVSCPLKQKNKTINISGTCAPKTAF